MDCKRRYDCNDNYKKNNQEDFEELREKMNVDTTKKNDEESII